MEFGERAPVFKLTDKQVMEIRNSPVVSTYEFAARFGVNQSTIWRIRTHKKHKRNDEGTITKKIREDIIALAGKDKGKFTDRCLETTFKTCLPHCMYVLDKLLDDGIVEILRRPINKKEKNFVYRLVPTCNNGVNAHITGGGKDED